MTVPRSEIFEPNEIGMYHCISRCVRRAYLCGFDSVTKNSYEHRRTWIRERLAFLVDVFSIELISYSIMMNHLHTLIRNRPDVARAWSPKEVARRWRLLFPYRWENGRPAEPNKREIMAIANDLELVEIYRERLSSISWFNRCLCEYLARKANYEDECKGRFWEGRFKSQKVYDTSGIIACSAYIDLNPIRAKIATTPEDSDFTSIQDRIRALRNKSYSIKLNSNSPRLISIEEATNGRLTTEQYLQVVDCTGRIYKEGKGRIPKEIEDIFSRIKINPEMWVDTISNYRYKFRRIIGPAEQLIHAAKKIGKQWFHGINAARNAFC